jgi:hypothetical protein
MNERRILRFLWVPVIALCVLAPAGCSPKSNPNASAPASSSVTSASVTATGASGTATPELVPGTVATPPAGSDYLTITHSKPPAAGTTRPTDAEIIAAAVGLEKNAGDIEVIKTTKVLGVTQDSKKQWWAYVVMNEGQDDQLQLVLSKSGKTWDILESGLTLDYRDMPLDVRF